LSEDNELMSRFTLRVSCLLFAASLCAFSHAKEHGGGGAPKPDKDSELAMADFGRAMALQADEIQKDQLRDLAKCSADADHALGQPAASDAVKNAAPNVACVQKNWKDIVKDLRKAQRSGLKAQVANANKASAELDRAALDAGSPSPDKLAHLKSANAQFFSALKVIASEMGVDLK